jgi:aarF domain-containing kinase
MMMLNKGIRRMHPLPHITRQCFGKASRMAMSTGKASSGAFRGRMLGTLGLAVAGGGVFLAVDDSRLTLGIKRSITFWARAFPMYLHYRYVEEVTRGKTDEEIDAAYNDLHDRYAARAVSLCISMGGYFYKAAQIVSTRDEFVPPQYMRELKRLQANAPPQRGPEEVKSLVEDAMGKPLSDIFSSFDLEKPLGAASIGQVHRAVLRESGQEVAVKVNFSHISAA